MFVHSDFEGLKVISVGKDGGRERVPVPWSHGDKRVGEWSGPEIVHFNRERVLGIGKTLGAKHALDGLLILTHQSTCRDNIYKIG